MLKSDCTPEQWERRLASMRARREKNREAVRAYHREYSQRPEAAEKRHAKNQTDEKRRQERERYQKRRAAGERKPERTPEQKRERYLEAQRKYWTPEKYAEIQQRRRDRDEAEPGRIARRKKWSSDYARLRNTGFTPKQYAEAMERQGGACAVCHSTKFLHADHDHDTGEPRGILCAACNQAEGKIKRSGLTVEEFARRLANYLANPTLKRP